MTVFVELDVQQMFSKGQTTDNSMCALDGIVSDIFDRLHSLKDDLITIISRKSSNGTEKTGLSCRFLFKFKYRTFPRSYILE